MDRHLEAIGLAVAHADLELIPQAIRRAYHHGVPPTQVRAAIEVAAFRAGVPAPIREWARAAAQAWQRIAHPSPAA
jgi:alkylhydroperoxidase/carboxymuconolactone decarboxylase family protein YurZ